MNESIKYEIEELPIKNEQIQLHYIIYTLIFAVLILFIYKFIKKMKNKKKKKYIYQKVHYNEEDNNIIDNESSLIIENIRNILKEPKIGLNNIGATCYMNATLQCLSHTKDLTNYFLSSKGQKKINARNDRLSKSYLEVIKKLWLKQYNNNKNNYSPTKFKEIISEMDPLFQGIAANDSKDLINFIIQQLHTELNRTKNNINNNEFNPNINQYDEQNMLINFMEDFKRNNCSIISDLFYGIIETITECQQCKLRNQSNGIFNPFQIYNFQIITFIIFPLEEIRKTKSFIYNVNFNEINIYDCFDFYEKEEIMDGQNQMWCKICKQNTINLYKTRIYSSPQYFILILNRGKGNIYNVKLQFQENINISKYVQCKEQQNLIYTLYAIVTHLGESSMQGHFIAFCRSPIDGLWYKYNDSIVELIGNFFNDIHEFGTPYILFYERQNL